MQGLHPSLTYNRSAISVLTIGTDRKVFLPSGLHPSDHRIDDDRYLESSSRDIGTIKVEIWRIANVQRKPIPDFQRSLASHQLKVHERSKKSGSHQTTSVASFHRNNLSPLTR